MLEVELTEEEELALVLKASVDVAIEEQAAQIASSHFDDVPGIFTISQTVLFIMLGSL